MDGPMGGIGGEAVGATADRVEGMGGFRQRDGT